MTPPDRTARPERILWLPPLMLLINLAGIGIVLTYSRFNLRPFLPAHETTTLQPIWIFSALTFILPTVLTVYFTWPIYDWIRRSGSLADRPAPPPRIVDRAANIPFSLGMFCLISWLLLDIMVFVRIFGVFSELTAGMLLHFIIRPLLAGLIASTALTFVSEYICRTHIWPVLFADTRVQEKERAWKIRVAHRLFLLWMAISFLPLSVVAFTAFLRMESFHEASDPVLFRVMVAIILIASTSAIGGAWMAWLVSRSIGRPLSRLEEAMTRLRTGDFSVRVPVSATDEIGALEEGFNLMTDRLSESYRTLEARNLELAEALDRVSFLESVKRGLDRFVPDTVRRLIEADPDAPALRKSARDVTVMFLDIEGYTRLSQELPRETLGELVERYFSMFLSDIRAEGGDINETAGDGLMILFQEGGPEDHAASAVRAAIAIREKTESANREAAAGHPPIAVNIGISSGECDVGSTRLLGAAGERWTFTATGSVTNLAARLGDLAQNGQIFLASETARRVGAGFGLENIGEHRLKNIAAPVEVWEVREGSLSCP